MESFPNPANFNLTSSKLKLRSLDGPLKLPTHVQSLDLSHLSMTEMPFFNDGVKTIDLRFNKLPFVPIWVLERNVTLNLSNNSLDCSCTNQGEIKNLLKYRGKIKDFELLVCGDGRYLGSIDVGAICSLWYALVVGGAVAAIGILTAIVVYYYNDEIKLLIYLKGYNFFIYEEEIDQKCFDVMISYSDEQERFVAEKLVPKLEGEGYKVCVRYRDWDIGDFIPEKVAELVQKSRRIVILLSNVYIESSSAIELAAALKSEKKDKRNRVLLVVTKGFEPDPNLEKILDKRDCLLVEDGSFWARLRKKLPRRREEKRVTGRLTQKTLNVLMTAQGTVMFSSKNSLEKL